MNKNLLWIYVLVVQLYDVTSRPVQEPASTYTTDQQFPFDSDSSSHKNLRNQNDEKVISVRITSSIAVARGNGKPTQRTSESESTNEHFTESIATTEISEKKKEQITDLPPNLRGANIEYLKQLNAKKEPKTFGTEHRDHYQTSALRYDDNDGKNPNETEYDQETTKEGHILTASKILSSDDFRDFKLKSISILDDALKLSNERLAPHSTEREKVSESESATENTFLTTIYEESEYNSDDKSSFRQLDYSKESKELHDSIAESSLKSVLEIVNKHSEDYENIDNVPLARSVVHSPSSKNYIQGLNNKPQSERESSTRHTTVSFNIVHDAPKALSFNDPGKPYATPSQSFQEQQKFYESPIIYSRPSLIYSEPAKIYSEPAKIYSEPAKIYSEPAKIYSEPAKIYSEPAKFYSEPASLHLKPRAQTTYSPWQQVSTSSPSTTLHTTPITIPNPTQTTQSPEKNYEVDEKDSVLTDGRSHGVQEPTTEKCRQENCKVGYVVKGRQFNKYRVEERTSDGFIVGEYGVVRNEDGALRGVRYTADSEASPRLIYDALMKFLQLK